MSGGSSRCAARSSSSGFNDLEYFVQAMTAPLAEHGATLAPLMRQAGFRYVFLGIENVLEDDLTFLKAGAKNTHREHGRSEGNATVSAIEHLHRHGLFVVGGLIVGNPDDTKQSIDTNLTFARHYIDWPYIQHPTPYPRTPMTREFRDRGLIVDEEVGHYDGTTAVVRSEHLSAREIEFLRWRAERWIKMRHFPAAFVHSPAFVLRHGLKMLAHTFAGSSLRSIFGLEQRSAPCSSDIESLGGANASTCPSMRRLRAAAVSEDLADCPPRRSLSTPRSRLLTRGIGKPTELKRAVRCAFRPVSNAEIAGEAAQNFDQRHSGEKRSSHAACSGSARRADRSRRLSGRALPSSASRAASARAGIEDR